MKEEIGIKNFPIWLLGDSEPEVWKDSLDNPLDEKHPIRHNIWTSIMDPVQDILFRECKIRINTSDIYIRNAVKESKNRPNQYDKEWKDEVLQEKIKQYRDIAKKSHPIIIFSFGAFAYEFSNRAVYSNSNNNIAYWTTKNLGKEFNNKIDEFNINQINIIPLLHRSISGGKFLISHNNFCDKVGDNYFSFVSSKIAKILIDNKDNLQIFYD